jgi:hypothetical protein
MFVLVCSFSFCQFSHSLSTSSDRFRGVLQGEAMIEIFKCKDEEWRTLVKAFSIDEKGPLLLCPFSCSLPDPPSLPPSLPPSGKTYNSQLHHSSVDNTKGLVNYFNFLDEIKRRERILADQKNKSKPLVEYDHFGFVIKTNPSSSSSSSKGKGKGSTEETKTQQGREEMKQDEEQEVEYSHIPKIYPSSLSATLKATPTASQILVKLKEFLLAKRAVLSARDEFAKFDSLRKGRSFYLAVCFSPCRSSPHLSFPTFPSSSS